MRRPRVAGDETMGPGLGQFAVLGPRSRRRFLGCSSSPRFNCSGLITGHRVAAGSFLKRWAGGFYCEGGAASLKQAEFGGVEVNQFHRRPHQLSELWGEAAHNSNLIE
ncbi:Hypothetical protein NTJ_05250 [Nesidiocoris tenuis]|uniref:Uncharacterized protein n=1 Tax=Nesidiocoris tenuis TaxID=355587 RepID=A0ABN7AJL6_9HEMI|nr:Hypothetical protein NTJ_05250 [Nesidiocoris tenuis]